MTIKVPVVPVTPEQQRLRALYDFVGIRNGADLERLRVMAPAFIKPPVPTEQSEQE